MRENNEDYFFLIIIAVLSLLLWKSCNKKDDVIVPRPVHIEHWDTLIVPGDTVKLTKTKTIFKPVYISVLNGDTVNCYSDTTLIDSATYIVVNDSIRGEKLFTLVEFFQKKFDKVITHTIIDSIPYKVPYKQLILSCGMELGYGLKGANLSPVISLKLKNDKSISFRYGLLDKSINIGLHLPLIKSK